MLERSRLLSLFCHSRNNNNSKKKKTCINFWFTGKRNQDGTLHL